MTEKKPKGRRIAKAGLICAGVLAGVLGLARICRDYIPLPLARIPLIGSVIDPAPSIGDVGAVADYISRNIEHADASDFKDFDSPELVYIFPDLHYTFVHGKHKQQIEELRDMFGLGLAGMEGQGEGEVTMQDLEKQLKLMLELQNKHGVKHQLAENEDELGFDNGTPKTIATLDDYIATSPLLAFAKEGDRITLVGLEDDHTSDQNQRLDALDFLYQRYFEAASPIYEREEKLRQLEKGLDDKELGISVREVIHNKDLSQEKKELGENRKKLEEIREIYAESKEKRLQWLAKVRKAMDEHKQGLDPRFELPDYDEGIEEHYWNIYSTPFYRALEKYDNEVSEDQRSLDCVDLTLEQMRERGLNQGAAVFGNAHLDQIKAELDRRRVSYIVVGFRNPGLKSSLDSLDESADKLEETLYGTDKPLLDMSTDL